MAKKPAKSRKAYNVGWQQFILAWQTSQTAQEVADKLGMPRPIVLARAHGYRKQGVKLKRLKRENNRVLDSDKMNMLILQIAEEAMKTKIQIEETKVKTKR